MVKLTKKIDSVTLPSRSSSFCRIIVNAKTNSHFFPSPDMQSRRAVCGDWSDAFRTHRWVGTAAEWQLLSCEPGEQHQHRPHFCRGDEKWMEQDRFAIRCCCSLPKYPVFFVCLCVCLLAVFAFSSHIQFMLHWFWCFSNLHLKIRTILSKNFQNITLVWRSVMFL